MTHIEQALKEAVEKGGYLKKGISANEEESILFGRRRGFAMNNRYETFLDPLFWQALGKAKGWWEAEPERVGAHGQWLNEQHRFIDHLAEGKDAESFFAELV